MQLGVHGLKEGLAGAGERPTGTWGFRSLPLSYPNHHLLIGWGATHHVMGGRGRLGINGQKEVIDGQRKQMGHGAKLLSGNHRHG